MQPVIDPYANISAAPNTDGDIPIADQDDLFRGEQVDFLLVIAGGTSATDTLLEIRALAADDGLEIPAIAIDSLHQLPVPVYSRSGKRVGIHPTEFFKLGLGGGRTEWAKLEVTKAFYLGRFKGFSMHESQYTAGNGATPAVISRTLTMPATQSAWFGSFGEYFAGLSTAELAVTFEVGAAIFSLVWTKRRFVFCARCWVRPLERWAPTASSGFRTSCKSQPRPRRFKSNPTPSHSGRPRFSTCMTGSSKTMPRRSATFAM